jgi:hypothetical protein
VFGYAVLAREMSHPPGMVSPMRTPPALTIAHPPTRRLGRGWCVPTSRPRAAARGREPVAAASRDAAPVLAAEPPAAYRPTTAATATTASPEVAGPTPEATGSGAPGPAAAAASGPAPFGLPVLAELPELAGVLEELVAADEAALRAVAGLASLLADEQVVTVTGVSVEQWIGIVAHHTRMDRRLLLRTARLLHRFPTLKVAVEALQLSWSQLRGLALALRDCPTILDGKVDAFLAELLPHLEGTDPDAVLRQVQRAIAEWTAELAPETAEAPTRNYLHLQPRLDGTGGRFSGEFDAVGLAIVDDATAPTRRQLDHPGGTGGARADNLLTRLTHTCGPTETPAADATEAGEDDATATSAALPAVKLLLRCDYAELLDATRTPADLLTRLVGGSLRLTSAAARRLLDQRGAELRTVIVDHGHILGVGRTSRVPPGWLRDATLAVHDTCTGPLCDRPALGADLDHARPWHPTHPGEVPGSTDVDNLGPLCATTNRAKETAGWRATQHRDGRRTWTHPRTGLQITSLPTTWRPPPPAKHPGRPRTRDRAPRDGPG